MADVDFDPTRTHRCQLAAYSHLHQTKIGLGRDLNLNTIQLQL